MAIRMGEGNQKGAEKILANCAVLLLGMSAVLTGAFFALRRPLLLTFGASTATLPYAESYLTIIAVSYTHLPLFRRIDNPHRLCYDKSTVFCSNTNVFDGKTKAAIRP